MMTTDLLDTVKKFLNAIESGTGFDDVAQYYHPDVEQIEFPNALSKTRTVRDLEAIKTGFERGKSVLQREYYQIINAYTDGNTVIIEAQWTGVLAIPIGEKKPGDEMKAHFAQFYTFKEGKIIQQKNYDCFEPF